MSRNFGNHNLDGRLIDLAAKARYIFIASMGAGKTVLCPRVMDRIGISYDGRVIDIDVNYYDSYKIDEVQAAYLRNFNPIIVFMKLDMKYDCGFIKRNATRENINMKVHESFNNFIESHSMRTVELNDFYVSTPRLLISSLK